jgi:hypothetical protein
VADPLAIPITLQVEAMVQGRVEDLLRAWLGQPPLDPRACLSVRRADVEHYFRQHPVLAQEYYDRQHASTSTDDIDRIEVDGPSYRVFALDHGEARFERCFDTLPPPSANTF